MLVAGVDPLRIYIHQEGLTRISTNKYALHNFSNRYAHLTNFSVNKNSNLFKAAETSNDMDFNDAETEGFKWSLRAFRNWLSRSVSPKASIEVFQRIEDIVIKTIVAAESDLTHSVHSESNYRTNCYELFGFDIMLDDTLTPHLIEVNISPSLMGSSPLDKKIKGTLMADAFHIIGFQPYCKKYLSQFDRGENNGMSRPKSAPSLNPKSPRMSSSSGQDETNPFSFANMSKFLATQDGWRKDPSPQKIDISKLENNDSVWLMLLMIEDEIDRAKSTFFKLCHPTTSSIDKYLPLYSAPRFSDHLLAKWVMTKMSHNKSNAKLIPKKYATLNTSQPKSQVKKTSPGAKEAKDQQVPSPAIGRKIYFNADGQPSLQQHVAEQSHCQSPRSPRSVEKHRGQQHEYSSPSPTKPIVSSSPSSSVEFSKYSKRTQEILKIRRAALEREKTIHNSHLYQQRSVDDDYDMIIQMRNLLQSVNEVDSRQDIILKQNKPNGHRTVHNNINHHTSSRRSQSTGRRVKNL